MARVFVFVVFGMFLKVFGCETVEFLVILEISSFRFSYGWDCFVCNFRSVEGFYVFRCFSRRVLVYYDV